MVERACRIFPNARGEMRVHNLQKVELIDDYSQCKVVEFWFVFNRKKFMKVEIDNNSHMTTYL